MTKCDKCGLFYVQDRPHLEELDCIDALKSRLQMAEARNESIRHRTCKVEKRAEKVARERDAAEDIAKGFVTRREHHILLERVMRLEQRYGFLLKELKGQEAA